MFVSNIFKGLDIAELAISNFFYSQNFVDDLQPHQERVGELVTQTENLLQADLVQPEEERRDLEYHLDGLKEAWLMVFDKTTARQNRYAVINVSCFVFLSPIYSWLLPHTGIPECSSKGGSLIDFEQA